MQNMQYNMLHSYAMSLCFKEMYFFKALSLTFTLKIVLWLGLKSQMNYF